MEALPGLAVAVPDPVQNPGLPPHRERITDKDPAAMKRAVRTVYTLFYLSLAGSIWAIAAYMLFPIESGQIVDIRHNNLFIGLGIALALLAIGIGAIHWSKAVMSDKEFIEPRHATRGRDATREAAVAGVPRRQRGVRLRSPHRHPRIADRRARRLDPPRHHALPRPRAGIERREPDRRRPGRAPQPHDVEEG
jgi:hypothetical protein